MARRKSNDEFYPVDERIERVTSWFNRYKSVHGLTIEELAKKANVNVDSLYRWQDGKIRIPSLPILVRLSRYTNEDLRSFISLVIRDPDVFPHAREYFQLENEERARLEEIRKLDDSQRQIIDILIRSLRAQNANQ